MLEVAEALGMTEKAARTCLLHYEYLGRRPAGRTGQWEDSYGLVLAGEPGNGETERFFNGLQRHARSMNAPAPGVSARPGPLCLRS
ncbi:hypothetical protein FB387_006589 [Streptomyces cinereoruber]|nr:hypothetical protein [Streptomyces cinereoruber]NIH65355.1 hypothetical protein [Streptomyces cinereoruber]